MTTTFFLVRHAAHDHVGSYLAGRKEGIRLGPDGRAQAKRLAGRMKRERFETIAAGPRERTQETAFAIAEACGLGTIETCEELDEIDFGRWSGRTFEELAEDPDWRRWNAERAAAATPGGETMEGVQRRVLACMQRLADARPDAALVLVSHADVIKAAVCHFLGLGFDRLDRFDVGPASVTTVVAGDWGAKVLGLNEVVT